MVDRSGTLLVKPPGGCACSRDPGPARQTPLVAKVTTPLMRTARRTVRTLLAASVAGLLVATLAPATPAAAVTVRVDKRFFGVHDSDPVTWPAVASGSMRLWDAGVTWADLEPNQGDWRWDRLDAIVTAAQQRGVELTLVLGQTPGWADDPASLGVGPEYMPRIQAWNDYVAAVVNRYRSWNGARGIAAYQVWNEANIVNYWAQNSQNNPQKMAMLTSAAYGVVKSLDPGALVLGPAFATRLSWQRTYLGTFYRARVNGLQVWKRMDAISLNLYPTDTGTPESSMKLLKAARKQLAINQVPSSKPIWNTEINYGLATGGSGASTAISTQKQAAYVLRTFLLNAANGVKRVHWYMWDRPHIGNTKLMADPAGTPTLAGKSFALAQAWMVGGALKGASRSALPCSKDRAGTYTCVITYAGGVRRVYWNPTKRVKVTTVRTAKFKVGIYGTRTKIAGGSRVKVDYRPVMVRSKA